MSRDEALSAPQKGAEPLPSPLAPLELGETPVGPALSLAVGVPGEWLDMRQIVTTVTLDRVGAVALRDWLDRFLQKPYDCESAPELWTINGMVKETGYTRRTVNNWLERSDFPRPFAEPVGGGRVWEADRVKAWLVTRSSS